MNDEVRVDNVYLVDTKMFGFERFNAAYIVAGKEIALIDCGLPNQTEAVRAGIRAHGFSPGDISRIFITHEHSDHCGSTTPLLRENPRAKVYINPIASEGLTDPSRKTARLKGILPEKMLARFGTMEPVPPSRIEYLNDGDEFDLGNGERLKIIFTPGHQPGGIVIHSKKSDGLFVNDTVGCNLADTGTSFMFTPPGSDIKQLMESLKRIKDIPVARYFLGHFGIWDNPGEVIQHAMDNIQRLLDMGAKCLAEGKLEEIASRFLDIVMPEVAKIKGARPQGFYEYISEELVTSLSRNFTIYYTGMYKKQ